MLTRYVEVTNTPWGERHRYVLPGTRGELHKHFHVSPFLGMDHRYAWSVAAPGERLGVHIAAGATFDATLTLARRPLEVFVSGHLQLDLEHLPARCSDLLR